MDLVREQNETKRCKEDLKRFDERVCNLRTERDELQKQLDECHTTINGKIRLEEHIGNQFNSARAELHDQQDEIERITSELKFEKKNNFHAQVEITGYRKLLRDARQESKDAKQQFSTLASSVKALEDTEVSARNENMRLAEELLQVSQERDDVTSRLESANSLALVKLTEVQRHAAAEAEELRRKLDAADEQRQKAEKSLADMAQQHHIMVAKTDGMRAGYDSRSGELASVVKMVLEGQKERQTTVEDLRQTLWKNETDRRDALIKELEASLESERASITKMEHSQQHAINRLKDRIRQMETDESVNLLAISIKTKDIENLTNELREAKKRNAFLRWSLAVKTSTSKSQAVTIEMANKKVKTQKAAILKLDYDLKRTVEALRIMTNDSML
ncbi:hypothetical protein ACN47E_003341 [Coniothyrium glycines]